MTHLETLEQKLTQECQTAVTRILRRDAVDKCRPSREVRDEVLGLQGELRGLKRALEMVTNLRHDNPMSFEKPPEDCL